MSYLIYGGVLFPLGVFLFTKMSFHKIEAFSPNYSAKSNKSFKYTQRALKCRYDK